MTMSSKEPSPAEEKSAMSPLVVEILDNAVLCSGTSDACLCCAGPVDNTLSLISELVVEHPRQPVSTVLQELLAVPQLPADARLCQACLEQVLHYHQLTEARHKLQLHMRQTLAESAASRHPERQALVEEATPEKHAGVTGPVPSPHDASSPPRDSPQPPQPLQPPQSPQSPQPPEPPQSSQSPQAPQSPQPPQPAEAQESSPCNEPHPEINISIQVLDSSSDQLPEPARDVPARPCVRCPEPDCGRSFASRGLLQDHQQRRHRPPGRPCPECDLVAESEQRLADHIRAVHKAGEAAYGCDECEQRFHLEAELKLHRRSQHDCKRYIRCRHCRRVFRSRFSYLEHQAKHSGEKLIQCPVCSEKFTRRICLTVHMKVHRKHGSVHACEQCGVKFSTIGRVRTHQKLQHDIQQPWRCEAQDCGKSFRSRAALEVHTVNHTGDRQFSCDVCSKRFSTKHGLQAHYRIHTGERPFQCALCGRQFTHKSNLHQHNALAHKTERNHKCADCGQAFRRARELETHRSSAHPAQQASAGVGTLMRPLSQGHKQFKCAICQRAFLRMDNLRTHMFVHSEKKPFECRVCGLGFLRRPQLQLHMQTAGHGDGMADYIINEAVFVMDTAPAAGPSGSVRLISAGQHQVFSVVEDSGTRPHRAAPPAVAQIIFKTDSPAADPDSAGIAPTGRQIAFETDSPRVDVDSSRVVRQGGRQIRLNVDSPRTALDSPGGSWQGDQRLAFKANFAGADLDSSQAVQHLKRQIVFRTDSSRAELDTAEIIRLDEHQIVFKADSPRPNMDPSRPGRRDDEVAERWQ